MVGHETLRRRRKKNPTQEDYQGDRGAKIYFETQINFKTSELILQIPQEQKSA